jgi:GNAT superfamily N-acetyltransferase
MTSKTPEIIVTDEPDPNDRDAIVKPLIAFNTDVFGPSAFRPLAVLLRDPETGETTGGLWAKSSYDWLYVELLYVPEELRGRGVGGRLMQRAEDEALARGCAGVWLDTFGFQARAFYEKRGYVAFGELPDHPRGSGRYFMKRTLKTEPSDPQL